MTIDTLGFSKYLEEHGIARAEAEAQAEAANLFLFPQLATAAELASVKGEICPANDATDRDGYEERIASTQLLGGSLGLDASRIGDRETKRLAFSMRRL